MENDEKITISKQEFEHLKLFLTTVSANIENLKIGLERVAAAQCAERDKLIELSEVLRRHDEILESVAKMPTPAPVIN
jgi:hypothetical protein